MINKLFPYYQSAQATKHLSKSFSLLKVELGLQVRQEFDHDHVSGRRGQGGSGEEHQ